MVKLKEKLKNQSLPKTVHEKLFLACLKPDTKSHILVNTSVCKMCVNKECTKFCPAKVFNWSSIQDTLIIAYENCLECGACKSGCPYEVISYEHPSSGFGFINLGS